MSSTSPRDPGGGGAAPRRRLSLATGLAFWFAVSSFAIVLVATGVLYRDLARRLEQGEDATLVERLQIIRAILIERPGDLDELREEVQWEWPTARRGQFFARVLDGRGHVVAESPRMPADLAAGRFPLPRPDETGAVRGIDLPCAGGKTYRVAAARVPEAPGMPGAVVQVAWDRTPDELILSGHRRLAAGMLGLALAAVVVVGWTIARRGIRPVEDIARTAEGINTATLHARIASHDLPREIASLAGSMNGMLDRLQESFERLQRFSADIAHELRTPVNNLLGTIEVTLNAPRAAADYRETLASCLEECGRLRSLIESLLLIARADDPRARLVLEPLDLGREVDAVREFFEPIAREAGIALDAAAAPGLAAHLDRTLFQRALGNLLANAIAATPPRGRVALRANRAGVALVVEVADTGGGIPAADLPRVFDRFYRADASRSRASGGMGLGLAIVRSIATLHGGAASIASEPGRGTTVTLRFPGAVDGSAHALREAPTPSPPGAGGRATR